MVKQSRRVGLDTHHGPRSGSEGQSMTSVRQEQIEGLLRKLNDALISGQMRTRGGADARVLAHEWNAIRRAYESLRQSLEQDKPADGDVEAQTGSAEGADV